MKIKNMGYEDLISLKESEDFDKLSEKKQAKVIARLKDKTEGIKTDLEVQESAFVDWSGPHGYNTVSVQDLIEALNKVEDKSQPISWNLNGEGWGTIAKVIHVETDEEAEANGASSFLHSQVIMEVTHG